MAILTTCDCGTKLRARDDQAGKRIRCPSCSQVLTLPSAAKAPVASPPRPAARPAAPAKDAVQKKPRRPSPDEDDERPPLRKSSRAIAEDLPEVVPVSAAEDEDEKPIRKRSFKAKIDDKNTKARTGSFGPEKAGIRAGVLGGVIMMVIAVVWFFGGLLGGIIFFYPPILFIIGIVALIKGLVDGNLAGKKQGEDD